MWGGKGDKEIGIGRGEGLQFGEVYTYWGTTCMYI